MPVPESGLLGSPSWHVVGTWSLAALVTGPGPAAWPVPDPDPGPGHRMVRRRLISSQGSHPLTGTGWVPTRARHPVGAHVTALGRAAALHFVWGYGSSSRVP